MTRLFSLLLTAMFLSGCAQKPNVDYGGTVIDAVGKFQCFKNQLVVTVRQGSDGKLGYSIENARVGVGSATPAISESAHWFMFPESIHRVWIYDGAQDVTLVELYTNGGTKFTSSQVVPEVLSAAPSEFAQLLPARANPKAVDRNE